MSIQFWHIMAAPLTLSCQWVMVSASSRAIGKQGKGHMAYGRGPGWGRPQCQDKTNETWLGHDGWSVVVAGLVQAVGLARSSLAVAKAGMVRNEAGSGSGWPSVTKTLTCLLKVFTATYHASGQMEGWLFWFQVPAFMVSAVWREAGLLHTYFLQS